MNTVRMIGWKKGLMSVSLIDALRRYGSMSLADSKRAVDELLAGGQVTVTTQGQRQADEFKKHVTELGVLCQD